LQEKSKLPPALQFVDATADVQMEPARLSVEAGVANLRVYYTGESPAVPVDLTIRTATGLHRGVHMSRLVRAAQRRPPRSLERWMKSICSEVNRSQPGAEVVAALELPYGDQFAKVIMKTTERGAVTYALTVQGMTACPCSKKMIGIGHMQRAEVTLVLRGTRLVDSKGVIGMIGECFSAVPAEAMKRPEEARKILEAQANPRFVEDLVRECVKRFPNALYVRGRCFESIHAHDVVATWSARPGWTPEF
jgi:GTP cyclohydrolase FolE2